MHVSGVKAGHPRVEGPLPMVLRAPGQVVSFNCPLGCTTDSEGFLSESCEDLAWDAAAHTPRANLEGGPEAWTMTLDASNLVVGSSYRFCTKLPANGSSGEAWVRRVYVTGVTAAEPPALPGEPGQRLLLTCPEGCSASSVGFLQKEDCLSADPPSATSAFAAEGAKWSLELDLAGIERGWPYHLCTSLSGDMNLTATGPGDTGLTLYATSVLTVAPFSAARIRRSIVSLDCPGGCSVETSVYLTLADRCDEWVLCI